MKETQSNKSVIAPLNLFLKERIMQRCDYYESISNKHRTSSGYTQVKELIKLCELTHKRGKTIRSLLMLLEEGKSPLIKQNIVNDLIINEYFKDIREYILNYDNQALKNTTNNSPLLYELFRTLKKFETQLDKFYFNALKDEFNKIDYLTSENFQRTADHISDLVDLLIPYLLFQGYSISSLSAIIEIMPNPKIDRIINFFNFKKRNYFFFHVLGKERTSEVTDFINLMKEDIKSELEGDDINKVDLYESDIEKDIIVFYQQQALDPHNHVRLSYDRLLKRLVIKKERQSLATFNEFFDNSFWSTKRNIKGIRKILLEGDPINVNSRGRTLRNTLIKCAQELQFDFNEGSSVPLVKKEQLQNSIYYYNLALGSKSIENSLSLLWTSLEAMIPYRTATSDIESVQKFVASSLCIGAVCRDIHSFASSITKKIPDKLTDLTCSTFKDHYSKDGLLEWFNWLSQKDGERFEIVKNCSPLLSYQYCKLGKSYSEAKLEYLEKRIKASYESIVYQLQRIYLHRNQIVHSGDFVNEYTNLWMHLEWYVGKMLAFFVINSHFIYKNKSLEDIYRELEADHDYLCSYLEKNRSTKIKDMSPRIVSLLFQHSWQSF
ncbi:hypothetical protein QNI19_12100 [Cytophagaceae bacterium DM2B3-1]|uniref:Apea-like HEPN domain-containing protein n=1 Tax=Xanthocytophaga flava TaxID=3048013 RepID=A0ABT7CIZ3_9BACT|nr:hypothetical protein [Xanthocytophaga flavus]MDJ1493675.1 hypothetical protein [Xanthocytophaga flavus]